MTKHEHRHQAAMLAGGICYYAELVSKSIAKDAATTLELLGELRALITKAEGHVKSAQQELLPG